MLQVYVTNNGSVVGIEGGRFKITQKDQLVKTIPKESVESISIFGNSTITTPCMQYLLEHGISVSFFSSTGKYFGRLEATSDHKIEVVKKQIQAFDDDLYALKLAQKMIFAKITNQQILLKRYIKLSSEKLSRNISLMKQYKKKAMQAEDVNQLMGYEGIAARTYFDSLALIINPDFQFKGRNRRPPRDPFNSLLSLGYTLLIYEIYAKLQIIGMTPYYSILHKAYANNPSLASDLMEEWRTVIVDSVALSLIQGNELRAKHFETEEETGGVYLTNEGLRKFLKKFERKMNTEIKYLQYDNKGCSMREALSIQCGKLKESLEKRDPEIYQAIMLK